MNYAPSLPPVWLDPAVFLTNLAWTLIRSFVSVIACFGLGLAGVKILDRLTPSITEIQNIKRHPLSTALRCGDVHISLVPIHGLRHYATPNWTLIKLWRDRQHLPSLGL